MAEIRKLFLRDIELWDLYLSISSWEWDFRRGGSFWIDRTVIFYLEGTQAIR